MSFFLQKKNSLLSFCGWILVETDLVSNDIFRDKLSILEFETDL